MKVCLLVAILVGSLDLLDAKPTAGTPHDVGTPLDTGLGMLKNMFGKSMPSESLAPFRWNMEDERSAGLIISAATLKSNLDDNAIEEQVVNALKEDNLREATFEYRQIKRIENLLFYTAGSLFVLSFIAVMQITFMIILVVSLCKKKVVKIEEKGVDIFFAKH